MIGDNGIRSFPYSETLGRALCPVCDQVPLSAEDRQEIDRFAANTFPKMRSPFSPPFTYKATRYVKQPHAVEVDYLDSRGEICTLVVPMLHPIGVAPL